MAAPQYALPGSLYGHAPVLHAPVVHAPVVAEPVVSVTVSLIVLIVGCRWKNKAKICESTQIVILTQLSSETYIKHTDNRNTRETLLAISDAMYRYGHALVCMRLYYQH